jgi:AraC family transcriptional activator of pobA
VGTKRERSRRDDGPPNYTYVAVPGVPSVIAMRLGPAALEQVLAGPHSHDYLVLDYFERDGGSLRLGQREWSIEAGDVYVIAPGEIADPRGFVDAAGWAVIFPPEALGFQTGSAFFSWRTHPLLFPFVRGIAGGAQRLQVPQADRSGWSERFRALQLELQQRRDGYHEAVMAHLTLLLVSVARLAMDVVGNLRLNEEPLLAEVFGVIEERYHEHVSLKDVAGAVSLSPGHLTTVVRRKTGRTVQEWIVERRLAEARRLLVETDLTVEEVGQRVGYDDPGYFVRSFRRAHGATPLHWRRAGRP